MCITAKPFPALSKFLVLSLLRGLIYVSLVHNDNLSRDCPLGTEVSLSSKSKNQTNELSNRIAR